MTELKFLIADSVVFELSMIVQLFFSVVLMVIKLEGGV